MHEPRVWVAGIMAPLSSGQRDAFDHVTSQRDLVSVVGYAGSGKSAMLGVARDAWKREGYNVRGASLSGIAAENLETGSGITSQTIASLECQWKQGRKLLSERDVLVINEAGLTGMRRMETGGLLSSCERTAQVVRGIVRVPRRLNAPQIAARGSHPRGDMVGTQIEGAKSPRLEGNYLTDLSRKTGAGEGIRTLDFNLGKVALYP